jgi:hypothetical protein
VNFGIAFTVVLTTGLAEIAGLAVATGALRRLGVALSRMASLVAGMLRVLAPPKPELE